MLLYTETDTVIQERCKEWSNKTKQAKAELDKLNGVNKL